jgi:transcriptional regulator with XRE-family HTH domain
MIRPTSAQPGPKKARGTKTPITNNEESEPTTARRSTNEVITWRIARNLRRLREERQVSQTQLAAALGVTFQQVQKYEAARNRLSGPAMARAAQFLRVPVEALFAGIDAPEEPEEALAGQQRTSRIIRACAEIHDEAVLDILIDIAKAFGRLESGRCPLPE